MVTKVAKFTFTVPEDAKTPDGQPHADAGKRIEKSFEYQECTDDSEAATVLTDKKLSVLEMVNDKLKANARSNAYQSATLVYKPSTVSEEDIVERMVRDYIRLGASEQLARQQVAAVLAATKASQ